MLALLGESPVNVLEDDGALVSSGIRMLRVASLREQSKSWWFNKEQMLLTPDASSGYIYAPEDGIRIDPIDAGLNYVLRGRRLYNVNAPGQDPYKFAAPVTCWLIRMLPFEDLPASAQLLVSYAAQIDFQKAYDADPQKFQQVVIEYKQALMTINAEHTRNLRVNILDRPSVAAVMNGLSTARTLGHYRTF